MSKKKISKNIFHRKKLEIRPLSKKKMCIFALDMERNKEIYKVTMVGGVVNVILLLFKFVAGILGHSAAMVADAVHSLSDFVTDVIVLVFVRVSGKPKDKSHDYGHGKYETLAMTIIGISLLAVAVGIIYAGLMRISAWFNGEPLEAYLKMDLAD